jgi:hypothetical protein
MHWILSGGALGLLLAGACALAQQDPQGCVVHHTLEGKALQNVLLVNEACLVLEAAPRFEQKRGIYLNEFGATTWHLVERKEGALRSRVFFDRDHVPVDWVKYSRDRKECLVVTIQDRTPVAELAGIPGVPTDPPIEYWLWDSSDSPVRTEGRRRPFPLNEGGFIRIAPDTKAHRERQPEENNIQYDPGEFKVYPVPRFRKAAPYPRRGDYPLAHYDSKRPDGLPAEKIEHGFSMWQNAGRPNGPDLKFFAGEGITFDMGKRTVALTPENGLPSNLVSSVYLENDATAWIGFYDAAVVKADLRTSTLKHPEIRGKPPSGVSIILASDAYVWVGTFSRGLYRVDRNGTSGHRVEDVPDCRVNDLKIRDNRIWAATSRGLYLIESDRPAPEK